MRPAVLLLILPARRACGEPADSPGPADATLETVRQAATGGNAEAHYPWAMRYVTGIGVVSNETTALKWMCRAAEQGSAPAQYELGMLYADGRGVPIDPAEAYAGLSRAADQGDPDAGPARDVVALSFRKVDFERAHQLYLSYRGRYPSGK